MERDEVLFTFHEAYERPTAENIIEWTRRYPQFADDIRAHAAVAWDWAATELRCVMEHCHAGHDSKPPAEIQRKFSVLVARKIAAEMLEHTRLGSQPRECVISGETMARAIREGAK
jgi:hypothetical protein